MSVKVAKFQRFNLADIDAGSSNMTAPTYSEFRCYSPMTDCEVSRISMFDTRPDSPNRFQEYWVEVRGEGKAYREAKAQALDDLMEAIEMKLPPGKVVRSST